ncbi:uncharacterized protein I303_102302 [Kwoniella dejecticola CBS 10117]|uniref:F-box domain-containing protein n=1 Tax=Kwoniella dejecticola CBS 10117 TaxID=1296121 RepID=A0A1A6ABC2_9TREE|nr:uncharacterized protein I303_01558 [Kwoniella dejecticola CBS 10117]OBR87356.1 hypothetical protein I303_01558 [Kwoniella dejecticola CBS 10117]
MGPKRSKATNAKTKKQNPRSRVAAVPVQTISFSTLPTEVTDLIFFHMINHSEKDLYNFIQVARTWYTNLVPKLYRVILVDKKNVEKVFYGLDITMDDPESFYSGSGSECDDGSDGEVDGGGNAKPMHAKANRPNTKSGSTNDKTKTVWKFNFAAEDIASRKVQHLQAVRSLIIGDWQGGKAIAAVLVNNKSSSHLSSAPFSRIETLSYGYVFLNSSQFYPDCACETQPRKNDITRQLATLRSKHIT